MRQFSIYVFILVTCLQFAPAIVIGEDATSSSSDAARKETEAKLIEILKKHAQVLKELEEKSKMTDALLKSYKENQLDATKQSELEKVRGELDESKKSLEVLKAQLAMIQIEAAKKDAKPEEIKERISERDMQLDKVNDAVKSNNPAQFKHFTAMKARYTGSVQTRTLEIEIEIVDGAKRIPLGGVTVNIYKQFKVGPKKAADDIIAGDGAVVLDQNGRAQLAGANLPAAARKDLYLIIEFEGNEVCRPAVARVKLR